MERSSVRTPADPGRDEDPRDDAALARLAAAGDRGAFGAIVRRHGTRVYSLLRRRCRGGAGVGTDADDLFQAAFLRAWERVGTYDPAKGPLGAWLLVIAGRVASNAARAGRAGRGGARMLRLADGEEPAAEVARGSGGRDRGVWAVVDRAVSPEAAAALWLRYAEGLTPAQIAAALGRTPVGVRVMLLRSLRRVRRALEAEGLAGAGSPAVRVTAVLEGVP